MKFTIIFLALVSMAYGANRMCWTLPRIAEEVIHVAANDSTATSVSYDQLSHEILNVWNSDSTSECLSYTDFSTHWNALFHDDEDTTRVFFQTLDLDTNDKLCMEDIAVQLLLNDKDPWRLDITIDEFLGFLHSTHPVPQGIHTDQTQYGC